MARRVLAWEPADWPGWRVEYRGPAVSPGPLVWDAPGPDAIPIVDGWLVATSRTAVHVASGALLADRWHAKAGRYQRTYRPADDEPADGSRYAVAIRVLAGELPTPLGRPKGTGDLSPGRIYAAVLAFRREYGRLPKRREVVDAVPLNERSLRRVLPRGAWRTILDTVEDAVAKDPRRSGP